MKNPLLAHRLRRHDQKLRGQRSRRPAAIETPRAVPEAAPRRVRWRVGLPVAAVIALAFGWSYWPTLVELVGAWNREPDYSHGFLVVPAASYLAWARRDRFPGLASHWAWGGLLLIVLSIGLRYLGARLFLGSLDGWSIPLWLAGVVAVGCGWRVLGWSLPAIAFLVFLTPLPYSLEHALSYPLQRVATLLSSWTLQCLGQPAFAEGNIILLNEIRLEVERACSGLRILMGVAALAYFYVALGKRPWWVNTILLLGIVPVALLANAARIVATGLLYQRVSEEAGRKIIHDVSGWMMIPVAAVLFALVLWYLGKLWREVEVWDVATLLRRPLDGARVT